MSTIQITCEALDRLYDEADRCDDYGRLRQIVRQITQMYRDDVRTAARLMNEEARRRGWCHEYEDFIDKVNDEVHLPWPPRNRLYDVTATFTIRITRQVQAGDDDDAANSIGFGGWYGDTLAQAIRNGETDWSLDDVSVEEAE